jgi:hypothetical protein
MPINRLPLTFMAKCFMQAQFTGLPTHLKADITNKDLMGFPASNPGKDIMLCS